MLRVSSALSFSPDITLCAAQLGDKMVCQNPFCTRPFDTAGRTESTGHIKQSHAECDPKPLRDKLKGRIIQLEKHAPFDSASESKI